jgi:hypothetical protein
MRRSLLVVGLLATLSTGCGPSAPDTGRLINMPGDYKVKGANVSGILVAPGPTNSALRLTIRMKTGSVAHELDLNPGWFVFVEPDSRVWAYYGGLALQLTSFKDKEIKAQASHRRAFRGNSVLKPRGFPK